MLPKVPFSPPGGRSHIRPDEPTCWYFTGQEGTFSEISGIGCPSGFSLGDAKDNFEYIRDTVRSVGGTALDLSVHTLLLALLSLLL